MVPTTITTKITAGSAVLTKQLFALCRIWSYDLFRVYNLSPMVHEMNAATQQKSIEKASKAKNPFEGIECDSYTSNGKTFTFYVKQKNDVDPKVLKWAFKLAEKNVAPYYKELKMGWQPKVKQTDLNKNWARYLIAEENNLPVAYAMFRFDMDYSFSVLYCYEVQIDEAYHRNGLGKYIMDALERCARHWNMEKVVLTVLKNNSNAIAFFNAIGYTLDGSSPDILENAEYKILSKNV